MITKFFDREFEGHPLNDMEVDSADTLDRYFQGTKGRDPFFCELIGANEKVLLLGLGPDFGSVQYSALDGMPPYLMAVGPDRSMDDGFVEFLMGGTQTPVSSRYKLSRQSVEAAAKHFLRTGEPTPDLVWEEI